MMAPTDGNFHIFERRQISTFVIPQLAAAAEAKPPAFAELGRRSQLLIRPERGIKLVIPTMEKVGAPDCYSRSGKVVLDGVLR
jgi:hypothetical protein